MKKIFLFTIGIVFLMTACKKSGQTSTIDNDLQQKASKYLSVESEKTQVDSALVLIMSVKTGEIKAQVKVIKSGSSNYKAKFTNESIKDCHEPGSLFIPFSFMAAMEEGKVSLDDSVDTGIGVYAYANRMIHDKKAGGFGKITLRQSMTYPSNIGTVITIGKVFNDDLNKFIRRFQKMSIVEPQNSPPYDKNTRIYSLTAWVAIGYNIMMTPMQIISNYNAIANNGVKMKAVYKTGQDGVINSKICSDKTTKSIQQTLNENGDKIFKMNDMINQHKISGLLGETQETKFLNGYQQTYPIIYFCGYYPYTNPEYTCLVIFYNPGEGEYEIAPKSMITVVNELAQDKFK